MQIQNSYTYFQIISECLLKYVLTAAHCTWYHARTRIFVRVGDTSLDTEFEAHSETIEVERVINHPGYSMASDENDIAVIVLAKAVSLTKYPNIKPACLPEQGATFQGDAIIAGWGTEVEFEQFEHITYWLCCNFKLQKFL